MKKLFILLVFTVGLLTSTTTFGQGTKGAPFPGSTHEYKLNASTANGTFYWWVAKSTTNPELPTNKATYGTDYTIVGKTEAEADAGLTDVKSIQIQWGNNISVDYPGSTKLYVYVKLEANGCSNLKYYEVDPVSEFNILLADATLEASGDHCPELGTPFNANTASYNPGVTVVQYKVTREYSNAEWSFDYDVTGANVNVSKITLSGDGSNATNVLKTTGENESGRITAPADNTYITITLEIDNVPGEALAINLAATNASDANAATDSSDPSAIIHNLKVMPLIGAFE